MAANPPDLSSPPRDELVIKVLVAMRLPGIDLVKLVQAQRRYLVEAMHDYTRLKENAEEADIGLLLVVDAEICRLDAVIRWLDAADARIKRLPSMPSGSAPSPTYSWRRPRRRVGARR